MKPTAHEFFEILAREHARMIYAFLRASGHSQDVADDLLQESLLVAWRKIDTFDRQRPFGPWLRGIAAKLSLARFRQSARSKETTFESDVIEHLQSRFDQIDAAHGFEFQEKLEILRQCLEALSDTEKQIVHGKYRDNSPLNEIAAALSINVETAKKRIQRARAKLRRCVAGKLDAIKPLPANGASGR